MKKLALLLLLCSACAWGQTNNFWFPTANISTQVDATSTYNLLTPIAISSTVTSTPVFTNNAATQSFNLSISVATQMDAKSTYRLLTPLNENATTSMAVTTFLRGTTGLTLNPTLADKVQADLNATMNLKTAINANPTIGMSVTGFVRSVQGNLFSPAIALKAVNNLTASLNLVTPIAANPTIGMAVTGFVQSAAVRNLNFSPTLAFTIATTGGFDSSGSVPGIGFATNLTASFLHGVIPLTPSMSVTTGMSVAYATVPAPLGIANTVGMTASNSLKPVSPAINDPTNLTANFSSSISPTASETTTMAVVNFIKNAATNNLNATMAASAAASAAFGTVSSPQIGVTALATANNNPGPNGATVSAVGAGATASFKVAASFTPTIGITTNLGIAQFQGPTTFSMSPQQTVTTVASAKMGDVNAAVASTGTSMTTGFASTMHAQAAPVTAMVCSFTVGRFNSSHKIMEIIS